MLWLKLGASTRSQKYDIELKRIATETLNAVVCGISVDHYIVHVVRFGKQDINC